MAAAAMAWCAGVPVEIIRKVAMEFRAVPHRIEFVDEIGGVAYYNDSKGTNPDAAIKGIQAMERPTLLIGGGYDKESSYEEWIRAFDGKVRYLVLIGQTREKIEKAAHECGIRIIVDISINHTGIEAEWFRKALSDPDSVERGFYIFQEDGAVKYWQGVKTLPQLNYLSDELRDRVYRNEDSAMQKYLKEPFMQDGWRLDVAPEVGRCGSVQLTKEVWREVRKALKGIRKDLYLVGEDWDDSSEYMEGDMWDAAMNYYGVSRPLRSWMGERDRFLTAGWGHDPDHEESWTGQEITEALRNGIAAVPDQSAYFQMNLIDSHDTPRLHNNKAVFRKNVYIGCVIAAFMLPGMPSIYYGDENLIDGEMGSVEASRYPMCWDESKWDADTHEAYKKMGELRKLPFIPYSSVRIDPIDNEAFSVARFTRNNAALAVINRCPRERHVSVDLFGLPSESAVLWYGNGSLSLKDSFLEVELPAEDSIVVLLSGGALPKA